MNTSEKRIIGENYEKLFEKTPNGGDYSEIYFQDEKGLPCKKDESYRCVILERTNNGEIIKTTYGFMKRSKNK